MRGLKVAALAAILLVPTALAATQVHPFRAETSGCSVPLEDCSLAHHGGLQIDCYGGSNWCLLALNMNATYHASLGQTSKHLRTYGRDWNGETTQDVCSQRASSTTLRCSGLIVRTIFLPVGPCKRYEAVAEALEQPVNPASFAVVASIGMRETAVSAMDVCRNAASVTVSSA